MLLRLRDAEAVSYLVEKGNAWKRDAGLPVEPRNVKDGLIAAGGKNRRKRGLVECAVCRDEAAGNQRLAPPAPRA